VRVHHHELPLPDLREDPVPQVNLQRFLRPPAQRARCREMARQLLQRQTRHLLHKRT
jgi:hypothetical protein